MSIIFKYKTYSDGKDYSVPIQLSTFWGKLCLEQVKVAQTYLIKVFEMVFLYLKWNEVKVSQSCLTLCDPWTIQSLEFSRPEYWCGNLSLLQGIFPTQKSNTGLPHCRLLYWLSHIEKERKKERKREREREREREKERKKERKWSHSAVSNSLWPRGL